MREIGEHLGAAMRCTAEFEFDSMTIPVVNNAEVGAKLRGAVRADGRRTGMHTTSGRWARRMSALFMDDIPGMYFFVGAKDQTADAYYGHHHPRFSIDEDALPLGVALLSTAVAAYVLPECIMPMQSVFHWLDGRGWLVFSGGGRRRNSRAGARSRGGGRRGRLCVALRRS